MAITYLKRSPKTSSTDDTKTREIVENILKDIEKTKEEGCKELSKKFDKYEGDVIVSKEKIEEIKKNLDQKTKDDIQFSHERVRKFAEAQLKNYGQDFEVELSDGLFAGQADVLLVPSVEVGNGLVKMMIYFMGACAAGVVIGGKVPVVITSRSDEAQARLASIAAAVVALD